MQELEKILEEMQEVKEIMLSPQNIDCFGEPCKENDCCACVINKCMEIVKKRMNDGWISVDNPPETGKRCLVKIKHHAWIADYDSDWIPEEEKTCVPLFRIPAFLLLCINIIKDFISLLSPLLHLPNHIDGCIGIHIVVIDQQRTDLVKCHGRRRPSESCGKYQPAVSWQRADYLLHLLLLYLHVSSFIASCLFIFRDRRSSL